MHPIASKLANIFTDSRTVVSRGVLRFHTLSEAREMLKDLFQALPADAQQAVCGEVLMRGLADSTNKEEKIRDLLSCMVAKPTPRIETEGSQSQLITAEHATELLKIVDNKITELGVADNKAYFQVNHEGINYSLEIAFNQTKISNNPQDINIESISTKSSNFEVQRYTGVTNHEGLIDALQEIIYEGINAN